MDGWGRVGAAFAGVDKQKAFDEGQLRAARMDKLMSEARIKRDEAMQREGLANALEGMGLPRDLATVMRGGFDPRQATGAAGHLQTQGFRSAANEAFAGGDWEAGNRALAPLSRGPIALPGSVGQNSIVGNRFVEATPESVFASPVGQSQIAANQARASASAASARAADARAQATLNPPARPAAAGRPVRDPVLERANRALVDAANRKMEDALGGLQRRARREGLSPDQIAAEEARIRGDFEREVGEISQRGMGAQPAQAGPGQAFAGEDSPADVAPAGGLLVRSDTDIELAIDAAVRAINRGAPLEAAIQRLVEMGVPEEVARARIVQQ